jgi:hypothetical protein
MVIDSGFAIGTAVNNQIYAIALQQRKIIVVGNFTSLQRIVANRVLRLLPTGALDSSFNVASVLE